MIGFHDWQSLPGSEVRCGKCYKCYTLYCGDPVFEYVCIAPGCRATKNPGIKRKARIKRTKAREAERALREDDLRQKNKVREAAREQKAKDLKEDRERLAQLKMELIRDEASK